MKLIQIIADVLKVPAEGLNKDSSINNVENWTSMKQMMIISSIEKEYHIRFSIKEVKKLHTIGDFEEMICQKGVSNV